MRRFIAAAFAAATLAAPAAAQDWRAEWQRTVAAAEAEGEVIMLSQPNVAFREYVQSEFSKAFPKITLNMSVIADSQFNVRVRTERASGKYLWDVAIAGSNNGYNSYKDGLLDEVLPEFIDPELKNPNLWGGWDEAFVDKAGKYVFAAVATIGSPWFNAAHVPPEQVAREGMKVLLDPKYQGKIVWHDPLVPGAGQAYGPLVRTQLGDEGLRRVVVDQKTTFVAQQQQVVEAMARSTAWLGIGPPVRNLLGPYRQAGVNVEVRPFGNGPNVNIMSIAGTLIYVFDRRPHPNATRVFINWFLSRDVQHGVSKATSQRSRRADVPPINEPDNTPLPGVKYLSTQREEQLEYLFATGKMVDEMRKSMR
jgi:ABC-type glycerol-3-phosphate transport system substrate-binding protein